MYLLYYRVRFWVFVRDGMTLRIRRSHFLCPLFPESRYWDVRHLGVLKFTVYLFFPRTPAAGRQTLPLPPSSNGSRP
jgi:hypothetical protein